MIYLMALLVAAQTVTIEPPQKINWGDAYAHAANGKVVRIFISNLNTTNKENPVEIYLVDGDREDYVISVNFYVTNESTFLVNMSGVLKGMKLPPSKKAKILLRSDTRITCKKVEIQLAED